MARNVGPVPAAAQEGCRRWPPPRLPFNGLSRTPSPLAHGPACVVDNSAKEKSQHVN